MNKKIYFFFIVIFLCKYSFGQTNAGTSEKNVFTHVAGFDKRVFNDDVNFSNYRFDTGASFASAVFKGYALFSGSTFNTWSNFNSIKFKSWADFDSVTFQKEPSPYLTYFDSTEFEDSAFFYKAILNNSTFKDCHFYKWAYFGEAKFDSAYFANSIFDSSTTFDHAQFITWANFDSTHFQWVNFEKSSFGANMNFVRSVFDWDAYFDSVTIVSWSNFTGARFKSICNFSHAKFGKNRKYLAAAFNNVRFDSTTWFIGSHFNDIVDFSYDTVFNTLYFDSAKFGTKCFFSNLIFKGNGDLSFFKTVLPDSLDFSSNPNIPNIIKLSDANFTDPGHYDKRNKKYDPHLINLYQTDVSKLQLDYIHFKLYFDPADSLSDEKKEIVYEALLNNFKNSGQQESYKRLYKEYQRFRLHIHWYTYPISLVNSLWWGFGYAKMRIFAWTLILLLVFTIITFTKFKTLNENVYTISSISNNVYEKGFSKRFWYSFVYTSTVFFRFTLKVEDIKFSHTKGAIYLIVVYVMGLVCLAYMANFILQK